MLSCHPNALFVDKYQIYNRDFCICLCYTSMVVGVGVFRCCGASGLMQGAIDALCISLPWSQALARAQSLGQLYMNPTTSKALRALLWLASSRL